MIRLKPAVAVLLLTTGLSAPTLGQEMHHSHGGMTHETVAAKSGDSASTKAFEAADAAMMRDMAVGYSGDADVDFRTHMIPHHQGAVAMAKVALSHARNAETKAMARKIIDDQEKEIAEMQAWLKARGR